MNPLQNEAPPETDPRAPSESGPAKARPGKVVWITGAAGGLGEELVRSFLASNWSVAAAGHGAPPPSRGPNLLPMALDVTQPAQVRKAIESILARWKEVDVLVNNAAAVIDEAVWRMTETAWDQVIAAGLKGAFLCSRAVAQAMATQGCGHIINISSAAGRKGGRGRSNYAAAKAGLLGLTVSLARELAPSNILVNAVLPGVLPTAMTRRLSPPQQEELVSANVLCRMNAIDEVAAFVVHLAGMRNVSGQVFQLDSRVVSWI